MKIVAAIHGILTGQTDPSWPDKFDAWCSQNAPGVKVLKKEYRAWALPRFNNWFKNPMIARGLVNEIQEFAAPGLEPPTLWFVAHSNGAVIAMEAAKLLIERGFPVAGLLLTGAASEADVDKSHVRDWIHVGLLGKAIAYSSEDDAVVAGDPRATTFWLWKVRDWIWGKLMWPYGCLGRTGWTLRGREFAAREIWTRRFTGGHSSYFTAGNINTTFESFRHDMSL